MRSLLLSWFLFPHQNPTVRNRTKGVRRLDAASGLEKEMLLRTSTHTRTHVPRRPIGNAIHLSTYRTANYSDGRMLQKNTTQNSFGECGPEARGLDLALGRRTRKKNSARNNGASSKVQKHSHTHTPTSSYRGLSFLMGASRKIWLLSKNLKLNLRFS